MEQNIFLDMDGVLADFVPSALEVLNLRYGRNITLEQYAKEFGKFGMNKYYGISMADFWAPINESENFWIGISPIDWAEKLYSRLSAIGTVTILTAPSDDPICSAEKLEWLDLYLGIKPSEVLLGHRKHLLAGNGYLVDDRPKNVTDFKEAGGGAILVPSNWNTLDLTFDMVWKSITKGFKDYGITV